MSTPHPLQNPFVGLRPFESEDSLYFFGRDEQTHALLRQLHEQRFVAVAGSSGSGKSSLVRAGVVPSLEAGFLVQDRDRWLIATLKPGSAPLRRLAQALLEILGEPSSHIDVETFVEAMHRGGVQALTERLQTVIEREQANLFLLVDQFEEVFRFHRMAAEREDAAELVALLLGLAEQRALPVFVCLTMRSDFLGDCDAFYGLPEALNRGQYLVPRLTRGQRREAITGPVRLAGAGIAPRLVDRLLNENIGTRDDLPVLQHALMRTWEVWAHDGQGPIDIAHYETTGTVQRALDNDADQALRELSPGHELPEHDDALSEDQCVAKRLFQALTEIDPGNRRIRRPAHLSEVAAIAGTGTQQVLSVIERFRAEGRSFLVLSSDDPAQDPLIDISHESLIRQWQRLNRWVDEEAESAQVYRRLADTARLHAEGKAGLYRDPDLQMALDWQDKQHPNEEWARRYAPNFVQAMEFLEASHVRRDQEAEQERQRQAERERLLRRTQISLGVAVALLLIVIGAAWYAWRETAEAQHQTLAANFNLAKAYEEKALNALKEASTAHDTLGYRRAWLYAAAALDQRLAPGRAALEPATVGEFLDPAVAGAAFAQRWASPALNLGASVTSVAFSPDGRTLASGSYDRTVRLWEVGTGKPLRTLEGHTGWVSSVAFSPDGRTLASGSWDKTVRLWEVGTGKPLRTLEGHTGPVSSVAFSPDGRTLASGSYDRTVRLWEVGTGKPLRTLEGHTGWVSSVAFSPDGRTLASGSWDKTVRLWEVGTGKPLRTLEGHTGPVSSVAFSPDGRTLASGSWDKTVRLWEVGTGKPLRTLEGHTGPVSSVAFSPDGRTLALGSEDKTVRLWEVATGKPLRTLEGHTGPVSSVAFSPDGRTLASGSWDKTVRLWEVGTGKPLRTLEGHTGSVSSVAFSPDGRTLASGSEDKTVRLWELEFRLLPLLLQRSELSPVWLAIMDAARFLWELDVDGLDVKPRPHTPTLLPHDGQYFLYDPKFRPLLAPPAPGETKFDQVYRWAEQQAK